jgi:mono/diheme cytochrome c family protein
MFRAFLWGVFLVLLAEAIAFYFIVTSGTVPAAADNTQPVPLERWSARSSLRATLNRDAPKGPNPVALTVPNLLTGVQLYTTHCMVCHGDARGRSAPTPIARGEYPRPPQLASEGVEDDPMGWDFWKIQHGIRWTGMPAWGGVLNDQQIWTLSLFLKNMDKLPPPVQQAWQQAGQSGAAGQALQPGEAPPGGAPQAGGSTAP